MNYYKLYQKVNNKWSWFSSFKTKRNLSNATSEECFIEAIKNSYTTMVIAEHGLISQNNEWKVEPYNFFQYYIDEITGV